MAKEIAKALKTDEWWYSWDQNDDYTPCQIVDFIANGEHVIAYEDNTSGVSGEIIWFLHDKIQSWSNEQKYVLARFAKILNKQKNRNGFMIQEIEYSWY